MKWNFVHDLLRKHPYQYAKRMGRDTWIICSFLNLTHSYVRNFMLHFTCLFSFLSNSKIIYPEIIQINNKIITIISSQICIEFCGVFMHLANTCLNF